MTKREFWQSLDPFTRRYLETALWSSSHTLYPNSSREEVIPLDDYFEGKAPWEVFSMDALKQGARDCKAFQDACAATLEVCYNGHMWTVNMDMVERAGHDFWLTRCRHGAGFWDGDYEEPWGRVLTQAAHAMGERDLYVSGKLVCMT